MSGMLRGGLLVGADSVADVVDRGLGGLVGGGGEGEEMLCIVLAWLLSGHFA
jgi:hypothetical protein